jgi:hypothetical protein
MICGAFLIHHKESPEDFSSGLPTSQTVVISYFASFGGRG